MFKVGDKFQMMAKAKDAVNAAILDTGRSYKVYKRDPHRYLLICKTKDCPFKARITYSQKTELATVTKYHEHECSPAVHYNNRAISGVQYLKVHHRKSVIDNCQGR